MEIQRVVHLYVGKGVFFALQNNVARKPAGLGFKTQLNNEYEKASNNLNRVFFCSNLLRERQGKNKSKSKANFIASQDLD
jgi:hypothetical protein